MRWRLAGVDAAECDGLIMRATIIGSGDAFGSGGQFNTCFWLETAKSTLLVDCGASSLVALKVRGAWIITASMVLSSPTFIATILAALPFLLLDAQVLSRRERSTPDRRPPGNARTARRGTRSILSEVHGQQVAVRVGGHRDRDRAADRFSRPSRSPPPRSCISLAAPVDGVATIRRPKTFRLFGRHRMGRRASLSRRPGGFIHCGVLWLFWQRLTGHITWNVSSRSCRDCARDGSWLLHMNPTCSRTLTRSDPQASRQPKTAPSWGSDRQPSWARASPLLVSSLEGNLVLLMRVRSAGRRGGSLGYIKTNCQLSCNFPLFGTNAK